MHPVKCSICGKTFDRDKVECVNTSTRRYAHKSCYDKQQGTLSEEEKMKQKIFEYTKHLFKDQFNKKRIETQLLKLMKEHSEYTYSGIFKTLVYWYEIKNGIIEKSNYGLGIVPYIYNDAFCYYKTLWEIQQRNNEKNIDEYIPKQNVVKIKNPQRNPLKKERHFDILLEEGGN